MSQLELVEPENVNISVFQHSAFDVLLGTYIYTLQNVYMHCKYGKIFLQMSLKQQRCWSHLAKNLTSLLNCMKYFQNCNQCGTIGVLLSRFQ